ncbi:MAG TPA: pitrilysin family protein, partial [Chthoniobacteraceae bacterium]|nr:pitrilysin family protein [Chthoniobacteraceae bacterium]
MLFKGTPTRSPSAFAQSVQDVGGYINAYTSFDRTVYWIDVPARGVLIALELLADAVRNSTLPADEFIKEQEVIRREFAMGSDDPDRMASLALFAAAYREHPCRHPVIGHLDIFNTLTRDNVMAYYQTRYVPNNMFFVVAGDVDAESVRDAIAGHFAQSTARAVPPVFIPAEPLQIGRRERHQPFATELTRLHLAWHVPAVTDPDVPALDILAVSLGGGRSARLYKQLREQSGIVHSIDAWCYAPAHPGLFGVDAVLDPARRAEVEREILRVIGQIKADGISEQELEKSRKIALMHQLSQLTTARGKASDLGGNWLLTRNLEFSRDYLEAINRVSRDDIARVIERYLRDSNVTVTSLNPPEALASTAVAAAASIAADIATFNLSNDARLLVREDHRLPLVSIVATFKAGLLAESSDDNGITRLLSKVLLKGTKRRTAEQIADEIEAVGGSISSDAGNNSLSVTMRVMKPDLSLAIDLLADVLLHATLPEKAVDREKEVQLAGIKADEEEIVSVARHLLREQLLADHPYALRPLGTPESVARITQADLAAFRDRYICARNAVFAVFGDVNADEVRELVQREMRPLPPGEPALTNVPSPRPLAQEHAVERIMDKTQAVLMVGYRGVSIFDPDRAALELIDEASSDLGSRFFIRIREEMGLAYFVGSSQLLGLAPGAFVFYLGTDPAKLTAVKAELLDEIRGLVEDGLSAAELARAREKLLGQQEIRNQSNDAFAFSAALDELYGLGANHYRKLRAQVEAVTADDIRRVARKYFAEQPPVIAVVRPG